MSPTPALIALLREVGEAGFRLTLRGGRLVIVGSAAKPGPEIVARVRGAKAEVLRWAPELSWTCQVIVWPAATWLRYDARVREIAATGLGRLEAEYLAYSEFEAENVVRVEPAATVRPGAGHAA